MMEYKTLDEQVREEGIQEGINKTSIEAAKRMLNDNLSFDSILSYLPNLTIETLNSLKKEIISTS